ncbi:hypothetical protein KAM398_02810 [Acinetobacter sp. KAM398]|nr:hypothetical protein KAM392_02810 [Acinetobacter sp. KAM392]GJC41309.1 hypothetical protein KAM396_00060 [Acinetobacter sp. KAM396]GJC47229.1 hypothetical protein KAM398_02810 [Acinetobacter sp. KAM398]GJC69801.1 hypothetical protein KAM406_02810 [Acinetobacter sp. KAM406]
MFQQNVFVSSKKMPWKKLKWQCHQTKLTFFQINASTSKNKIGQTALFYCLGFVQLAYRQAILRFSQAEKCAKVKRKIK